MTELTLTVKTKRRQELIDVTARIESAISDMDPGDGLLMIYVPHTTAAVTINESADPSVAADILAGLDRMVPDSVSYRHAEGNSPAHIKATLVGASALTRVEGGRLKLGTWQGVFFCEFDGPRQRRVVLSLLR